MEKYINMQGYTDTTPYEVIKVISDKTLEIRSMTVEKNPDFKPDFIPGGFSAHCTNNYDQKWLISSNPEGHTIRVRKRKTQKNYGEGVYWHQTARYKLAEKPHYFYDYNF
mgnify:FL=1|jgi:hypothetical protein